jgi:hypothetical protein
VGVGGALMSGARFGRALAGFFLGFACRLFLLLLLFPFLPYFLEFCIGQVSIYNTCIKKDAKRIQARVVCG